MRGKAIPDFATLHPGYNDCNHETKKATDKAQIAAAGCCAGAHARRKPRAVPSRRPGCRQQFLAARAVPAADARDARPHRSRRGAEAEHSHRHELSVLRRRRDVVYRQAQAPDLIPHRRHCDPEVHGCHAFCRRGLPAGIGTRPAAAAFPADPKSLAMIEGPAFCRALVH